jgi:rRNA-processing protein FCF1
VIRRPLLVDTNVLVLFAVGSIDPKQITHYYRTRTYNETEFEIARQYISNAKFLLSTPNIWTEFSNLTPLKDDPLSYAILRQFVLLVENADESYLETRDIIADNYKGALGLTDNVIARIALKHRADVLSDDGQLCDWLGRSGIKTYNVRHARTPK